jgi:two-component system, response regulator PdtaR
MQQAVNDAVVVLLVEDEPLVRMLGTDVLEDAGFKVIEAENGDAAVTVLEARTDVQVLFTDVDMPGSLDGLALAWLARERWPQVAIVIVSGKVRPGPGDMPPGGHFVPKPYQPNAVVELIRDLARAA